MGILIFELLFIMREDLQKQVRDDCYQVFVLDTPIYLPLSMFRHAFIVTNDHGKLTRWEVLFRRFDIPVRWGYVHQDFLHPWRGLDYFPISFFGHQRVFDPRCLGVVQGDGETSLAGRMVTFMHDHASDYEYKSRYNAVLGPNSNSFVQWFLDHFPDANIELPALAVGRGYKKYTLKEMV